MKRIASDVAVIGAGPAGLSAALAAARAGATVDVLDAGFAPGGQYWMEGLKATPQSAEGHSAVGAVRAAGATIHCGAEVWGVFPDRRIGATGPDGPMEIAARALVVASGAHDRVMPFPGWTLPGVMTPGAAQRLAKLGGVPAGRRMVLAGSGPFLLAVARTLVEAGTPPVALIEAQPAWMASGLHLLRHPRRWREAAGLLRGLRSIPDRRRGWVVTEAVGSDRVEAVTIAPLRDGAPDLAAALTISDVDALLVGWGFRPSIDVTALLRCTHVYDRAAGGWICRTDAATGLTSVPGVYAAGEVTGIAGARPATAAGTIAGLSAAESLGHAPAWLAGERATARGELRDARRFAEGLNRLYEPPRRVAALATPDTLVCRCEEVTRRDIEAALAAGARGVQGLKHWTRAGMGPCQGRMCGWAVAEIEAAACGRDPAASGFNHPRIPLRPVPLATVLAATDDTPV